MNTPGTVTRIRAAYTLLIRVASWFQSPLLLVLRLYWGFSFFQTGWPKLGKLGQIAEYFASLGIPYPGLSAVLATATECFGGLLLMAGFASRLTAIPLIITMTVAYVTAEHEAAAAFFTDSDKFISSAPLTYLLVSLIIFVLGPGAFSVDYLLGKKYAPTASVSSSASKSA
jgi:putative oxidoreductase